MTSFTLDTQTIILLFATFLTGLSSGLCFAWANTVIPGIGQLDNLSYLKSFQQMNRVIINPMFMVVFFGPLFLHVANVLLFRAYSTTIFGLLAVSASLYILGVGFVTIFGNVPSNEILDKVDLAKASSEELHLLRNRFEVRWRRLHFVRTVTGTLSFVLLLISITLISKHINL